MREERESLLTSETRNVVEEDATETIRIGAYTFHALIALGLVGHHGLTFAAVRVGDHAHVEVLSGRIRRRGAERDGAWEMLETSYGGAGWLVLRWPEWLVLRAALDVGSGNIRVVEVEHPTPAQARRYLAHGATE